MPSYIDFIMEAINNLKRVTIDQNKLKACPYTITGEVNTNKEKAENGKSNNDNN